MRQHLPRILATSFLFLLIACGGKDKKSTGTDQFDRKDSALAVETNRPFGNETTDSTLALAKIYIEKGLDKWIKSFKVFNIELEKLTGKTIPVDEFQEAFSRMEITYDPIKESLFKSANDAFDIGFLGDTRPNLSDIYDLKLLNEVLEEKGLEPIP